MTSKPLIAVDIDEVLFPMVSDLIKYVDREHGVKLTHEEFIKYDIRDIWRGGQVEASKIFEGYKSQDQLGVAPVRGSKEALHKLSLKYDIIVMTARDIQVEAKTNQWILHHFPDLFKDVHLVGNQRESTSFRRKAEVCKEIGVFCLIDDSLRHILETHDVGIKTILFGNYPWNQAEELPSGVQRVEDWKGVLDILL